MRGGVYAALTEPEKEVYRARARARYDRLVRGGLCPRCGTAPRGRRTLYCDECYFQKSGPSRRSPCLQCGRPCNVVATGRRTCWRCAWGKERYAPGDPR